VSAPTNKQILNKLLLGRNRSGRLWAALAALCVGTTLLLVSVIIWWDFNELLYGKDQNDSLGSTFLVIGKKVTDQNMGMKNATLFTSADIDSVTHAPQVQEVGLISSNHFPVYAMAGGDLAFATDLPLESVPDNFIDKLPGNWNWQPGSADLPIIVSSQFLDLYNYVFAPSQGLPQLSESSVKLISMNLKVGGNNGMPPETVRAHVVGFSDRIGSVLAPQSFIDYGNQKYGKPGAGSAPSQLILKTKDPSDTHFAQYIESHQYSTNSQNLRWSRVRAIVEAVTGATGILAILLMGIGTLVFVLFIELTIVKAQASLALLKEIGYSPRRLSSFMSRHFVPLIFGTLIVSLILSLTAQYFAAGAAARQGLRLQLMPGWPLWAAAAFCLVILLLLISNAVKNAIKKG